MGTHDRDHVMLAVLARTTILTTKTIITMIFHDDGRHGDELGYNKISLVDEANYSINEKYVNEDDEVVYEDGREYNVDHYDDKERSVNYGAC